VAPAESAAGQAKEDAMSTDSLSLALALLIVLVLVIRTK
jgi:hypothetical protein